MADLTGKLIANSYRNLLQAPGPNDDGLASGQSITIQDGAGNSSGLALSQAGVALTGTINIQGTQFTGTGAELDRAVANAGTFVNGIVAQNGSQSFGRTLTASTGVSISNANGTSGNPTFSLADSGVTSATYGPTTMLNIDSTGRVISTDTTAVVSATTFEGSNVNAQFGNFTTDVSVGGQLTVTGSFSPTNISTSIVSATNIAASVATINNLTVNGDVSAIAYYGDGSNLTGIVAASATNASYAASAGEAAVAVSAHHASSATFATSADTANFATTATNASFAISATNATNATSAVFASSATNATNAITVNYGGVVQTSTANIGDVSASSLFVSGNVSANGTLTVGGQVSVGGGIKVIGDVSAGNIIAGGIFYGDGAGLFNVPSAEGGTVNFVKAGTGIHVTLDGTTTTNPITASGTLALDADQSFGIVSATSFVGPTITSINSVIAGVSSTMATSIDNTNSNVTALSATLATSIANHLPLAGGTMTGAITLPGNPSANLEAATKQYVDNLTAAAIHFHDAVRVESPDTAGNLNATYDNGASGVGATLTNAGTQAALVIDGVTLNTSDRVLIYNQTNAYENGVYTVTDTGSASTNWVLTRATDADSYEPNDNTGIDGGSYFYIEEGDTGAGEAYVCSNVGVITIGTTPITFVLFSSSLVYSAGTGININGSRVISVSGVATDAALTALSATMATSIDNSNTLIAATSAALATSISNTNANVTTNINAITSINAVLGDGSGFVTDAELAAVSATLATSISNHMPLSGGTFTGNVNHGDNVKAQFGASNDLQIYHDGSHSRIDEQGTGVLFLQTNGNNIQLNKGTSENMLVANVDGSVDLYYDNSKKLATTNTGVDVTGTVTADGLTVETAGVGRFYRSDNTRYGDIFTDNNSFTLQSSTDPIKINAASGGVRFESAGSEVGRWDASGNLLVGQTTANSNATGIGALPYGSLYSCRDGGAPFLVNRKTSDGDITLFQKDGTTVGSIGTTSGGVSLGSGDTGLFFEPVSNEIRPFNTTTNASIDNAINLGNSTKRFKDLYLSSTLTNNGTGGINIDTSGNVGINNNSPSSLLHLTKGTRDLQFLLETTPASGDMGVQLRTGSGDYIGIASNTGTGIVVDSSNNVGIGVTPGQRFDVGDNATTTVARIRNLNGGGTNTSALLQLSTANNYANLTVNEQFNYSQFQHAGNLVNHYSDVDNHYFRTKAGGQKAVLQTDRFTLNVNSIGSVQTTSVSGSVTPSLLTYNSFVWTLTGNITLNNTNTEVAGMSGVFIFIHSGAGRTVSLGTDWKTAGGAGLTLSSTAGAVDMVPYFVQSTGNILLGTPMLAFS